MCIRDRSHVNGILLIKMNYDAMTSVYNIDFLRSIALYLYLPDGQLLYSNNGSREGDCLLYTSRCV